LNSSPLNRTSQGPVKTLHRGSYNTGGGATTQRGEELIQREEERLPVNRQSAVKTLQRGGATTQRRSYYTEGEELIQRGRNYYRKRGATRQGEELLQTS